MIITVAKGVGRGPTRVAAFDSALQARGVGNYNLIRLSSVIPPGTDIIRGRGATPEEEYGHRLYCVIATKEVAQKGHVAAAGIGWIQGEDKRGLFVEIEGHSAHEVEQDIHATLDHIRTSRDYDYANVNHEIIEAKCLENGEHTCVLVVAVYQSQRW
jgi:arginine decarboxylase